MREQTASPSKLWKVWNNTATRQSRKEVLIDTGSGESFTNEYLLRNCEKAAAELTRQHQNLSRKLIAISIPNGLEWISLFLGIQKLGAIPLLLDHTLAPEAQVKTAQFLNADYLYRKRKLHSIGHSSRLPPSISAIKVTSGTTGKLKPVPVTSEELLADGKSIISTMGISPRDRSLALIPFGHAYGLGNLVLPLILQSTAIVQANEFVPRQIGSIITKYKVNIFPGVPSLFRIMNDLDCREDLGKLRLAISAGAFLPPEVAQLFFKIHHRKIHNFYGSTETGAIAYDRTGNATLTGEAVGNPMKGVKIRINKDGRLAVFSPAVAQSQLKRKKWFLLPDLAGISSKGAVVIMGRLGTVANIAGKKVHPAEVESTIRKVDHVSDAWVTILQDPRGDDFLAAAIETAHSQSYLEQSLQSVLPAWKIPKQYFIDGSLPRTARGKLHTEAIKSLLLNSRLPRSANGGLRLGS